MGVKTALLLVCLMVSGCGVFKKIMYGGPTQLEQAWDKGIRPVTVVVPDKFWARPELRGATACSRVVVEGGKSLKKQCVILIHESEVSGIHDHEVTHVLQFFEGRPMTHRLK